ncbi:phosphoribosylanthranilate isomerase [Acuticoccus sediminis]|uniref:phosphoribosylanthranilate isomerase n=1 Tax=Acuticoccus sediminis TaxID=2184697 RepID=UPI001CFEB98C|nr:phosphoribosylanthranilate isomerase [Acuticoccus sediminis]
MRTRIKICGIASREEAWTAISAGADALGFVSPMPGGTGTIPDATIAAIAADVPPPVATVLLTAETTAAAISDHVRRTRTTAVQIVTHVDPDESARLAELEPAVRRIQVVHVEGPEALGLLAPYEPHVHAFLLDSGRPSLDATDLGGTGRTHDWTVSARIVAASARPVFLAGGLNARNVGEAIGRVRPFGVDLYSGVRTGTRLDRHKLADFVRAVSAGTNARERAA